MSGPVQLELELATTLTPDQARAVDRGTGSLLLAASAGSGKTSVLVERYARAVLEDGLAPAQLLAITFTERAAGELRARVRARFAALGERDAVRGLEGAFIGTIHGFCARLLRAHPLLAGLDPRFRVLSETAAAGLRSLSFERALATLLQDRGGGEVAAALDLVAAYTPDRLARMIGAAYETLRSRGQALPQLPPVAARAAPERERAQLLAACAQATTALAREPGEGKVDAALRTLELCGELLSDTATVPMPAEIAQLRLCGGRSAALECDPCRAYEAARADFERACADYHAAAACVPLDRLLRAYGEAYEALKRDRGAVDFDDLELRARDLLASNAALRETLGARYERLMVDEFQDTNPRQLAILEALERDNLFTVGDEFQSIYGFRHADVEIFKTRRAALAQRDAVNSLAVNFRARPQLLDVINTVFEPCFGDDFAPLTPVREAPAGNAPLVELLVTDTAGWGDPEWREALDDAGRTWQDSLPPAPAWRHAEARLLAQRVDELVADGAAPDEIAVLLRSAPDIAVYERALQDRGLPTLAAGGGGYWSHQQVTDLVNYLAALANPLDERALYGVLASPLVGVSSDALALIAAAAHADDRDAFSTITALDDALAAALADADRAALQAFGTRFVAERRLAPRLALDTLLERALADSGYDLHVLGLVGGERRLANVYKLLRLAREFEATEGRDLRRFVDHAATQDQLQAREPEAPIEDPERPAIGLMTIHAAKGLEFDVVCIADTGRSGRTDAPELLVEGQRVGLRLAGLDGAAATPALDYRALHDRRLELEAAEERRIFYVAMTRARERLLLSGAANVANWPQARPGAAPLSWLGPALLGNPSERLDADAPVGETDGGVRYSLSSPATLGRVLRPDGLAPPARPVYAERTAPRPTAPANAAASRPAPAGVALAALSYTSLTEYQRCGYRFYVQRVLGLPDEPDAPAAAGAATPPAPAAADELDASLRGRVRGRVVHELLEMLDFADPRPPDRARLAAHAGPRSPLTESDLDDIARLVAGFAASALCARLARAQHADREHPFAFALEAGGGPLLTGVLDVVAEEQDGGKLIVDYKSDRVDGEALESHVERDYAIQRRVYALAALRAGAPAVEVVYCYLERPQAPVACTYGPADAERLADELGALVNAIGEGRFEVAGEPHRELCLTCPARRSLCSWDESLTLRPRPDTP